MGTAEARVLAAGETIVVDGREYRIRPVCLQSLQDLQQEAVRCFKRDYLRTFADNLSLLGDRGPGVIEGKMDEVARWTIADLPPRSTFDVSSCNLTERLRQHVRSKYGVDASKDQLLRNILASLLDSGELNADQCEQLTGTRPKPVQVPFDSWWVTGCYEGMCAFLHSALAYDHPELQRKDIARWPLPSIMHGARVAERLTVPDPGNSLGSASDEGLATPSDETSQPVGAAWTSG